MNLSAIFSKTGKGVQESSGKTSHLSRGDRAVLSAIDGKTQLSEVQKNFEKLAGPKFEALIQQLDKDGFIREVSSGQAAAPSARPAAPPPRAAPPPPSGGSDDDMDFTQAIKLPPKPAAAKAPPVDLAAASRADAERKAKEAQATDYKTRQEAEVKAKAEAEAKARAAAAEAKARAEAEARARAEAEAKAKAKADADSSRALAEADAKVKAAREAAVRMATEVKAKAEADARVKTEAAEKDKARLEAELNAKLEAERKAREDAERRAVEAADRARKELEAEMKAKLDAERKAREEEERKRREEEDRRRKEEDERRAKEEAERRAREEADRKKREEEDRKRREDDERRRKEDAERRAREEADRKKREDDDRKRREDDDRRRKEEDERRALEDTSRRLDADRRAKEEAERRARDETERRAKDDAERRAKTEAEAKARAAADAAMSLPKIEAVPPPPPPPAAPAAAAPSGGGIGDSLLADLDSFGKREEEEQKEREEAERKAKEERARREKEEAERKAKQEAEKKRREEEERRRKEEEEQRAQEEAERQEREEEDRRKEEEAERKRKTKEAAAAKQAEERAAKAAAAAKSTAAKGAVKKPAAGDDDIPVSDEDLDTDDLKRDQKVVAEKARRMAREAPPVALASGRPKKWGKPAAIALFGLLIVGVGVLNFMPVSTAEYEKAASDAMGVPVKISSAHLSVLTGIEVKLEAVSIGSTVKIRTVRGSPEVGSIFGARKAFSRVELEGVQIDQSRLGDALLGKVAGENFRIGRVTIKQLAIEGPLKLPPLDVDAVVAGDGTFQTVRLSGPDKLSVTLTPKGSELGFEISATSLALPFVPALSLSEFSMKGTATRSGVVNSEFDGRAYDGVVGGTARIRWGDSWTVEGEVKPRNLKVAVFAPTLVSEGRVDGRAAYSMTGSVPASLYESAHMQGEFKIDKGVLGSFDVARALQTGGAQSGGRTIFSEMTGQGVYDKGTMQFTNVSISAGGLNAGASLNIDPSGTLSGRIVADVKTASQKLNATLNISGKVQDPVIRK